jgi:hypothetical protein
MKNYLLIVIMIVSHQALEGQSSLIRDLKVGAGFQPSAITQNLPTTCSVTITNNNWTGGTGPKDTLYAGSVYVGLSWTARTNALNILPTSGTLASKFTWTYYPAGTGGFTHGGWTGVSNQNITVHSGSIEFQTSGKNTGNNAIGANVNVFMIQPFGENNLDDNSFLPLITVSGAPLPIELTAFDAKGKNCSSVELNWNTASEINNAYFEVLRSTDGKEFLSLGKVEGTNLAQGNRYSFTDDNFLVSGNKYLYRLRQVDYDGKTSHFEVISYVHNCKGERSLFGVFPNPAFDRINTTFSGPFSDKVTMMLINHDGSVIRKMNVAPVNGSLDISGLSAGIYQLKVVNGTEEFIARFIKID